MMDLSSEDSFIEQIDFIFHVVNTMSRQESKDLLQAYFADCVKLVIKDNECENVTASINELIYYLEFNKFARDKKLITSCIINSSKQNASCVIFGQVTNKATSQRTSESYPYSPMELYLMNTLRDGAETDKEEAPEADALWFLSIFVIETKIVSMHLTPTDSKFLEKKLN